jgi:hypothetical protein
MLRLFFGGLALLAAGGVYAQTTQGLISGRVVDSVTGTPIKTATVSWTNQNTNGNGSAATGESGYYVLPLLSPGNYRIRVSADTYQAQEVQELELPVAARLDLSFRMRPITDVWEAGQYRSVFLPGSEAILTFYGPDIDTSRTGSFVATRGRQGALEATLSQVIDPVQVRELPLAGRDVYTMLVTQPAVTADSGTTRGLGLSAAGQRPAASNFLLDGVENNNNQVTGPLTAVAPEAVQEYRITTSNFSAEYGRTSGFLANAVTRSGGSSWHGIGYFNFKNDWLNANTFQRNLIGLDRAPVKENQLGFHAGGPLPRSRTWFFSSAAEHLRSRSVQSPVEIALPTTGFVQGFTAPNSYARQLLTAYPAPPVTDRNLPTATRIFTPPVSIDRTLLLQRLDWRPEGGRHQVMGRFGLGAVDRPDFIWSPYSDFVSGLEQNTYSVAVNWQTSFSPSWHSETRFGWVRDHLHWERAHPEIPTLVEGFEGVFLPGSIAFYGFSNPNTGIEINQNLIRTQGRHVMKFGGGFLYRKSSPVLTAGRDGYYLFSDIISFGLDEPSNTFIPLDRSKLPRYILPDYNREYRQNQFFFFGQDTFRFTQRLTLNFGLRYESFGAPRNTGSVKDGVFTVSGNTARVTFPGTEELYGADRNDFAGRFGFSWDTTGGGRTILRGAYGIFYDRPYDNLWQNARSNNFVLASLEIPFGRFNYLDSVQNVATKFEGEPFAGDFPDITFLEPNLRSAYVQNYLLGVQHRLGESWVLEATGLGSQGRKLITTDVINRIGSRPGVGQTTRLFGDPFPNKVYDVSYRANQGFSNYHGLAVSARYRAARSQFHLSYSWSHSIDNQSDALLGDFFDLSYTRASSSTGRATRSAFTRQFDSSIDRASSDFDQRHNLVFYSIWFLPEPFRNSKAGVLFRDWRISQLAAFRTGFPYTVIGSGVAANGLSQPLNNRPDLVNPSGAETDVDVTGGRRLLNSSAFRNAAPGQIGNLGRNAFTGPGLFNLDVSLARAIPVPWLGESGRITFRADAYNLFNHTNLNTPATFLGASDFGVARYGRRGRESGFPALAPFEESARQVQLILRLEF